MSSADADDDATRAETLAYFHRVEQMLQDDAFGEDEDDRDLFVGNVLAEIEGAEMRACCDLVCSRVLEQLVTVCGEPHALALFQRILPVMEKLLENRYGSHVVQALVVRAAGAVAAEDTPQPELMDDGMGGFGDLTKVDAVTMVDYVCREFQTHLSDYLVSVYGSHVLRATLAALSGLPQTKSTRSKASRAYRVKNSKDGGKGIASGLSGRSVEKLPKCFGDFVAAIGRALLKDRSITPLLLHSTANPVVQTLLDALSVANTELLTELCQKIAEPSPDGVAVASSNFSRLMQNKIGSHLAEKVIELAPPAMYHLIYQSHFRGRLKEYAVHPFANFAVSRLAQCSKSPEEAGMIATEITADIESILASNHPSVIIQTAEGCANHSTHQSLMIKGVFSAFHISTADDVANCACMIASMCTREVYLKQAETEGDATSSSYIQYDQHGSRLLQALLRFKGAEIIPLSTSLLALPSDTFAEMACDKTGSHVFEALLKADIGPKKKRKVLEKLRGHFTQLSMNKFGSHVVDRCWSVAEVKRKDIIAAELLENEESLRADHYGRFIMRNCKIDYFKRKQSEWAEGQSANEKKKKMFEEFYPEGSSQNTKNITSSKQKTKAQPTRQVGDSMRALGYGISDDQEDGAGEAEAKMDDGDADDEINDLFHKKKSRKKGGTFESAAEGDKKMQSSEPAGKGKAGSKKEKKEKKKKKRKMKEMEDVFAAVAATKSSAKKKRKKAKSATDAKTK